MANEMTNQEINEAVARKLGYGTPTGNALPDYCTSIAAAWEIFEKCERLMTIERREKEWVVYEDLDDDAEELGRADTAAEAICLAFLKLP